MQDDDKKFKEVVRISFNAVDIDGSGYIDRKELSVTMAQVAEDIDVNFEEEDINETLKVLDISQDGRISLDEYSILIREVFDVMEAEESWEIK